MFFFVVEMLEILLVGNDGKSESGEKVMWFLFI